VPLTSKQERFAQLVALEGLSQSEAYRQAYDVSPDSAPTTIWDEASTIARNPLVAPRIAELKASLQAAAVTDAAKIVAELAKAGHGTAVGALRWADKVAALDKMAKILGLYNNQDAGRPPQVAITQITVILDHSGQPQVPLRKVVEGVQVVPEVVGDGEEPA
jgi:hypothetical protein